MNYDTSNIDNIAPPYLASYGLTESPFSSEQDDRFLYINSSLNERFELLKHYTQYGNLLLLIKGERGIGKSSIKQRFINTAQEEWNICEIQSHTMMDASLLLRQIATGFNITEPPLEPSILFEVLSEQLEYMHQNAMVPILIIDDAHELPQDALQALLYLAEHHSDQHTALRIILFCEPEIETMLEDPAIHSLKDRVTHSMELSSLDEGQTAEYLRHRLAVAGLDGTSPFTPKLVNKIFKASAGVPGRINEYAHQNLLDDSEPFISDERDLDNEYNTDNISSFNQRNLLLIAITALVIIAVLFFQDKINELFKEPSNVIVENKPTKAQSKDIYAEASSEIVVNNEKAIEPVPVEKKVIEFKLNKEKTLDDNVKENIKQPTANKLRLTSINPSPVPSSKQRQIISISGTGFDKRQKVKVSWTDKEKILADTQVNVTSDSYMNLILNTGTKPDTWTVTVIDTLQNIESNTITFDVVSADNKSKTIQKKIAQQEKYQPKILEKKLAINKLNGLYGQQWIKQQNKNHFTLQLLGTHQKITLPQYLKKHSLNSDAAIFRNKRNNKDWFTLIYGNYTTKAEAQNAANKLPKGASKPWVRSFASILPSLNKDSATKKAVTIIPTATIPNNNQEGWLWSQDPSHYTLQLTAGTDKKAIQAFVKRHKLRDKAVYFHRLRDGKDWYILVHGSYAGYSKAKQAITQLPSAVRKTKPWTRTFGAIHAELN